MVHYRYYCYGLLLLINLSTGVTPKKLFLFCRWIKPRKYLTMAKKCFNFFLAKHSEICFSFEKFSLSGFDYLQAPIGLAPSKKCILETLKKFRKKEPSHDFNKFVVQSHV